MHFSKGFKNVEYVIFDIDGLLLDSESLYFSAYRRILQSEFKIEMPSDLEPKLMGLNNDESNEYFIKTFDLPCSTHKFQELKEKKLHDTLPYNKLMPGAQRLVEHFHKNKIPIALTTASDEKGFGLQTINHKDFIRLFHHVVLGSSDQAVKNGKPAPDIFLVCASRFPEKPGPEKCLVFEDSPNGVDGASAAGMQVVMVSNLDWEPKYTKNAALLLKSLNDFKPELFGLPPFPE